MTRRVLVIGAAGRLGAAVVEAFSDAAVIAHTRAAGDITDASSLRRAVAGAAPDLIVNCAAFNQVDAAEDQPIEAFAVNAFAVSVLARAAEKHGATLVHYSTDFVFDGSTSEPYSESAPPAPRSAYGLSKLLGEWLAAESSRAFVLRVESLFGEASGWNGRRGTLDGIVEGLVSGREVPVFTDRTVSPSYVRDVAAATRFLVDSAAAPGLYHCVNSGTATWHDVSLEAARVLGITPRLRPLTMDQLPMRAPRPRYCAMSNAKLAGAGFAMPSWQDALGRWLAGRQQGAT